MPSSSMSCSFGLVHEIDVIGDSYLGIIRVTHAGTESRGRGASCPATTRTDVRREVTGRAEGTGARHDAPAPTPIPATSDAAPSPGDVPSPGVWCERPK